MTLPPLAIVRDDHRADATLGKFFVADEYFSEMLENPWLDNKPNVSCIPTGIYRYRVTWSPRFKRMLIELSGVPGRFKIRLHAGNFPTDTEGCPLYGSLRAPNGESVVLESRVKEDIMREMLAPYLAGNPNAEGVIEVRDAA